jgi:hypothetical protein
MSVAVWSYLLTKSLLMVTQAREPAGRHAVTAA